MDNVLSKVMTELLPWRSGAIASALPLLSKVAERRNSCKQQNGSLFRDRERCFVALLVKKWSNSKSKWISNCLRAQSSIFVQPGNPSWRSAGRTSLDLVLQFGTQVGASTW